MELIPVVYIGNKEFAVDNVARSGKTWKGNGDIQEVTAAQAKLLLKHPKAWALANPGSDEARVKKPLTTEVVDEDGDSVSVETEKLDRKPLEKMSKPELVALAFSRWGKRLDARRSTKLLIDEIEELQNGVPELMN